MDIVTITLNPAPSTAVAGANVTGASGTVTLNAGVISAVGSSARTFANAVFLGGDLTFGATGNLGALTFGALSVGSSARTLTTVADTAFTGTFVLSDEGASASGQQIAEILLLKKGLTGAQCAQAAIELLAKWIHPELFADVDAQQTFEDINRRFLDTPLAGHYWISARP